MISKDKILIGEEIRFNMDCIRAAWRLLRLVIHGPPLRSPPRPSFGATIEGKRRRRSDAPGQLFFFRGPGQLLSRGGLGPWAEHGVFGLYSVVLYGP